MNKTIRLGPVVAMALTCMVASCAGGAEPAVAAAAAAATQPTPGPDEREVAALIREMSSASPARREAALGQLRALGPAVVPTLQAYVDHDDAETRNRVRAVIKSFEWINRGLIVTSVQTGGPAARQGILPGDVIVKLNDAAITKPGLFNMGGAERAPRDLLVWRDGRLREVRVGPGPAGVGLATWDIAKGGNDQSRGLVLLSSPGPRERGEAYKRLRRARDAGLEDAWTVGLMGCLAAAELDRAGATAGYLHLRKKGDLGCQLTHMDQAIMFLDLPFEGPHSAFLMEQFFAGGWGTAELGHEMEDWFSRGGRNYPMLRVLARNAWPHENAPASHVFHARMARMRLDVMERRWAAALARYGETPLFDGIWDERPRFGMIAAIHAGDAARAVAIAEQLMERYAAAGPDERCADAVYGLAVAAITGDKGAVARLSVRFATMPLDERVGLLGEDRGKVLRHPAAAAAVLPLLADSMKDGPLLVNRVMARARYLAALSASEGTTAAELTRAWDERPETRADAVELAPEVVTGFLRFGMLDRAREVLRSYELRDERGDAAEVPAIRRAIDFADEHAKRLAAGGDWSQLRGLVQVCAGVGAGTHWVTRYDGRVFFVDAAGKVTEFPGLPPSPQVVSARRPRVSVFGTVAVWRAKYPDDSECVPHAFDAKAGRWVSGLDYAGEAPLTGDVGREVRMLKYMNVTYPLKAGETARQFQRVTTHDITFEGDRHVWAEPGGDAFVDVSAVVAKAAGNDYPADVYAVLTVADGVRIIFSSAGVWQCDGKMANLRRLELPGLKTQNVRVRLLPPGRFGRPDQGPLIGVAPQQGGQIFEHDLANNVAKLTGGVCGWGPNDWYDRTHNVKPRPALRVGEALCRLAKAP